MITGLKEGEFSRLWRQAFQRLPKPIQAMLQGENIELIFLGFTEFEERFGIDAMRSQAALGTNGQETRFRIYVNEHITGMAQTRFANDWEVAIMSSVAHELAHVVLRTFFMWPILTDSGDVTKEDVVETISNYHERACDFQAAQWGFPIGLLGQFNGGV